MKRIYTILLAILVVSSVFAQTRSSAFHAVKQNVKISTPSIQKGINAADTDTLSNWASTDAPTVYGFPAPNWGAWSGHNYAGFTEYAEKFTTTLAGDINGALVYVGSSYSGAATHSVTFNIYAGGATPGAILKSKTVEIANMPEFAIYDVIFDSPTAVTAGSDFYIGYSINYVTPADTFNVVMATTRTTPPNTGYVKNAGAWASYSALSGNGLNTSLAIYARVALQTPAAPTMSLSPKTWAAGNILTGATATSANVTLSNIGSGNLTITSVTSLTGTPFTTTLVPSSVSLANGASTTFTFTYAPTVAGTNNQNFIITTNGGFDTVKLSGQAHDAITGNMLGDFENVEDFATVMPSWTLNDVDAGLTYGITDTDFLHSGEAMSFMAFNPASTTPALTTAEWAPHGGAKYGVCMATVTASAPNNDWLISPQKQLGTASTATMWVKSITDQYGLERYNVLVSTSGTAVANFTKISTGTYTEAPLEWTQVTFDLNAYNGQNIYLAVQCVSNDAFCFMVDDIVINTTAVGINGVSENAVAVYPNPANSTLTIANVENATITIYNVIGEVVKTINNASAINEISLANIAEGSYIVRIVKENNVITKKINVVK